MEAKSVLKQLLANGIKTTDLLRESGLAKSTFYKWMNGKDVSMTTSLKVETAFERLTKSDNQMLKATG